jgi:hypothetical protein
MKGFLAFLSKTVAGGLKGLAWSFPKHLLLSIKNCFGLMLMSAVVAGILPTLFVLRFTTLGFAASGIVPLLFLCSGTAAAYVLVEEMGGRKNSPMHACLLGLFWSVFGVLFIFLNYP